MQQKVYVIAEIGINHNGDLNTCLELIREAKNAGCDIVKLQKRNPDICVPEPQKNQEKIWHGQKMTYLDYKKEIEFSEQEYDIIAEYCKQLGINWTVSVWDIDSIHFMAKYFPDIPFIKIPSACITNLDMLRELNKYDIPVLISNGMSTVSELYQAVNIIDNLYGIMQCNSSYPSAYSELDLYVMHGLKRENNYNVKVGYSGHEIGYVPTLIAVALGAEIIERHITLDKNAEGSDHKASLDINELNQMMRDINIVQQSLGNGYKTVYPSEVEVKKKLRQI